MPNVKIYIKTKARIPSKLIRQPNESVFQAGGLTKARQKRKGAPASPKGS